MKEKFYRARAFANRCMLELVRDPLSYVFALGFPLVMLVVMSLLNRSIPPEAGMHIFDINNLAPGIYVFGLSFLMLSTALLVSKDRTEAFLVRLYISPMTSADFLSGYTVPVFFLAVMQGVITMAASLIIAAVTTEAFHLLGGLMVLVVSLPAMALFIGFGLLFGALLNDKAAPPLSSVIISAASFLGGMWMDVESIGGVTMKVCSVLPFYHAVKAGRMALALDFDGIFVHLVIVAGWAAVVYLAAIAVFRKKA